MPDLQSSLAEPAFLFICLCPLAQHTRFKTQVDVSPHSEPEETGTFLIRLQIKDSGWGRWVPLAPFLSKAAVKRVFGRTDLCHPKERGNVNPIIR